MLLTVAWRLQSRDAAGHILLVGAARCGVVDVPFDDKLMTIMVINCEGTDHCRAGTKWRQLHRQLVTDKVLETAFCKNRSSRESRPFKPGFHMICNGLRSVCDTIADRSAPPQCTDMWKHLSPASAAICGTRSGWSGKLNLVLLSRPVCLRWSVSYRRHTILFALKHV